MAECRAGKENKVHKEKEEYVKNTIEKAEHDYYVMKKLMIDGGEPADIICLHAQQCAEKYLKAYLASHEKQFEWTHDISELVELCKEIDMEFEILTKMEVGRLKRYATKTRYADEYYNPSIEETRRAVKLSEKTREFVRGKLGVI